MSVRRILPGILIAALWQLTLMRSVTADVPKGPYMAVAGGLAWTASLAVTNSGCPSDGLATSGRVILNG